MIIISKHSKNNYCHKIKITIKDSSEYQFINSKEILKYLFEKNYEILGKPVYKIKTSLIEEKLNNFPEIKKAIVYITDNGIFNIEVLQFKPISKIVDIANHYYYIDIDGNILYSQKSTNSNTIFVNGYIPPISNKYFNICELTNNNYKIINDIYQLTKYIYSNEFWKAQIQQIYVNEDREFELIPRIGPHIIILGDINNYETKLENLYLFYKEALNKIGWNNYKYINLKFRNQIICTKN